MICFIYIVLFLIKQSINLLFIVNIIHLYQTNILILNSIVIKLSSSKGFLNLKYHLKLTIIIVTVFLISPHLIKNDE